MRVDFLALRVRPPISSFLGIARSRQTCGSTLLLGSQRFRRQPSTQMASTDPSQEAELKGPLSLWYGDVSSMAKCWTANAE
jgi:hypothetical protein